MTDETTNSAPAAAAPAAPAATETPAAPASPDAAAAKELTLAAALSRNPASSGFDHKAYFLEKHAGKIAPATAAVVDDVSSQTLTIRPVGGTDPSPNADTRGLERDPSTGRFLPKSQAAAPAAAQPAAQATATETPAAPAAPVDDGLIELPEFPGVKLTPKDAIEAWKFVQTQKTQELEAERARVQSERQAAEAQARKQVEEAEAIVSLARSNPQAFYDLVTQGYQPPVAGPAPTAQPQGELMTTAQFEAKLNETLQRREQERVENEAKQRAEHERLQSFQKVIMDGAASVIPPNAYQPQTLALMHDAIAAKLAVAKAQGTFNPLAPPAVLRAQAIEFARAAKSAIDAELAARTGRQAAITAAAPDPVIGGGTMMPRMDPADNQYRGPLEATSIRDYLMGKLVRNTQANGLGQM